MAAAVTLDGARRVADALLHEGYLLYPYRASAQKNHSCSAIWWAARAADPNRAATAAADTNDAWNAAPRTSRSRPRTS